MVAAVPVVSWAADQVVQEVEIEVLLAYRLTHVETQTARLKEAQMWNLGGGVYRRKRAVITQSDKWTDKQVCLARIQARREKDLSSHSSGKKQKKEYWDCSSNRCDKDDEITASHIPADTG